MILRLIVLMVSGGTAYAMLRGWPDFLAEMPRACVAVLILLGGLSLWSASGKKNDEAQIAKTGRRPGWLDYCSIGMILLAMECGFLWLLSAAPEPLEDIALVVEEKFRPEAADERARGNREGAGSGNWLWDGEDIRVLPKRTNLKLGTRPEVFVRLLRPEDAERLLKNQVYVRAFALDKYEDGVWRSSEEAEKLLEAGEDGWIRFREATGEEIPHEVFHGRDPAGRNLLITLQGVSAVRLSTLRQVGEGRAVLSSAGDGLGYNYLASSASVMLKDVKGMDIEAVVRDGGDERMRELLLDASGEGNLLERLMDIEKYFKKNYRYSLVMRNPENLKPLENFLYGEKSGHCEFFATAGALMARELGAEARVAYGWAGGKFFKETNMFVFRAKEAHAWVEVKLPGYGWVVMDPTPPTALGDQGLSEIAEVGEKLPDPEDVLEEEQPEEAKEENVALAALGLAGGFGLVAGSLVIMRRKKILMNKGAMGDVSGGDVGEYFVAWRRAMEMRGWGKPGHTMRVEVRRLAEVPGFAEEMVRYHYGVRYEGLERDVAIERGLEKRIREWEN